MTAIAEMASICYFLGLNTPAFANHLSSMPPIAKKLLNCQDVCKMAAFIYFYKEKHDYVGCEEGRYNELQWFTENSAGWKTDYVFG